MNPAVILAWVGCTAVCVVMIALAAIVVSSALAEISRNVRRIRGVRR